MNEYFLLDSGNGKKLERFGNYTLIRPCSQAIWQPLLPESRWHEAHASFSREGGNNWEKKDLPKTWMVKIDDLKMKLSSTDFGHLGIFPEHREIWKCCKEILETSRGAHFLNLFAYSGGATCMAAKTGAKVCHVDASSGMVDWARENASLNDLSHAPIRWIVDDVIKFLKREVKRGVRYDAILLDPPTFGRGAQKEVFKIERDLHPLLDLCKQLLSDFPLFLILTCHTPGLTPTVLQHLISQKFKGRAEFGELFLFSPKTLSIPSGSYIIWKP